MRQGFLYLVAIIDWATRRVLSWRLSNTLTAGFCVEALSEALARFGKLDIFNTDSGRAIHQRGDWVATHASRRTQPALLPEHHLGKRSVNVHADYTSHPLLLSCAVAGAVGNRTTTDPRSQRNRVGRRGGQLLTRALGP
jgi:transposase InsO family protein